MKQKIFVAVLVLMLATVCLVACSNTQNYDGLTKVVFNLEGGIYQNSELPITHYYNFEKGTSNLIVDPQTLSDEQITRNGYRIAGWYKTKTQNGDEVVYSDKWNFETDKVGDEGVELYARWEKNVDFTYNVCYIGTDGQKTVLGTYTVEAGEKFSDYRNFANRRPGWTALGEFKDAEGNDWDADFVHPGGEESLAIDVYPVYIEGDFAIVRTASELRLAKSKNIYLMADIDLEGGAFSFGGYRKIFKGNGHTISNFEIAYGAGKYDLVADHVDDNNKSLYISLFGNVENAEISDVRFENVTLNVETTLTTIYKIYVAPICVLANSSKIENVTIDLQYAVSKLPTAIEADPDRFVVFDTVCGVATDTTIENCAATVAKAA